MYIDRYGCVILTHYMQSRLLLLTKEEVLVFARVCLSVFLSVSKITQKYAHGFG